MSDIQSVHLEIEAKFRVASHERIRERLIAAGAESLGTVLETNEIFDAADGSLRRSGRGVRIRSTISEETQERSATMTFKGPVRPGPFKSREEQEVVVSDAATASQILRGLGLVRVLRFQKRRESWRLDDCLIELDEPPHIGLFVEIEGPGEAAIAATATRLGLDGVAHEKASYVRMLHAYCVEHGIADFSLALGSTSNAV